MTIWRTTKRLLAFAMGLTVLLQFCPRPHCRAEDDLEFFEQHIRPILVERCLKCHSADERKTSAGLALDTRQGWLTGGDSGPAIIPGQPEESLLVQAINYREDGPQMPPEDAGGKLPDGAIALLTEWVRRGAPDPRSAVARIGGMNRDEAEQWWSFQPITSPPIPTVRETAWPRNPIDHFILSALENQGLPHASPAPPHELLRRITFDLTGLPPTPEELEAFLADSSAGAIEEAVDWLLQSPAHGERWARHWLDVVRYADYHDANPKTRVADSEVTEAWRYRDWVVKALNEDLPFDQFIKHQIAGDLIPSPRGEALYADGLVATTFLCNGVWDRDDADKAKIVSDIVDDNIDVIGKSFLGLTLNCARCHDHKFDPITTEDYYGLAGMFYSTHILKAVGTKGGSYIVNRIALAPAEIAARRDELLRQIKEVTAQVEAIEKQVPKSDDDDLQRTLLFGQRNELQRQLLPEPPLVMAVQEGGTPDGLFPGIQDVPIHIRGSYTRLGIVVPRRLPSFFAGARQPPITRGSGRRELADWIASANNPLTARVIVNRVWQWHFGEGLARTASNFGKLGEPPSHPQLLDWLAAKFIEDGWSLKKLHRRILLSATYQQSSRVPSEREEQDPQNRWLGRFSARRLEAEAIRDAMLFASGQLDPKMGGPAADDFTTGRRSLYVQTARWDRGSYANLFDAANPDLSTEKRTLSTIAPQSLLLLNHPFVHAQARHLAQRLARDAPQDDDRRIELAYKRLFARLPGDRERRIARQIVSSGGESGWADLSHVLYCSNEFVYLD